MLCILLAWIAKIYVRGKNEQEKIHGSIRGLGSWSAAAQGGRIVLIGNVDGKAGKRILDGRVGHNNLR